jgi:hypothetical protein
MIDTQCDRDSRNIGCLPPLVPVTHVQPRLPEETSMTFTGPSKLTWSDFQAAVPADASHDAFTSTSFKVDTPFAYAVKSGGKTDFRLTAVQVRVTLNRAKMWSVAQKRTDKLLQHEQGHADITTLAMRDLHADLEKVRKSNKKFPTQQALEDAVAELQQPILDLIAELQSTPSSDGLYDRQTKHSADAAAQKKWDAAFKAAKTGAGTRLAAALKAQGIVVP